MGTDLVKYGSYDLTAATEEGEQWEKSRSTDILKLEVGRNVLRFMPPSPGSTSPFRVVYQHYLNPPGGKLTVLTCPRMEAKQSCPVCFEADRYKRSGSPADRDAAYKLFPTRRVFANVIDRKDPESGVKVVAFGKMVHEALIAIRKDEDAGGDFTSPTDGFDIIVEREGTGATDTRYKVLPARKQSPLGNMEWLDQQHDLGRFAAVRSAAEITRIMSGEEEAAPQRGKGGGAPRSGGGAPQRQPKGRTAEDDLNTVDAEYED